MGIDIYLFLLVLGVPSFVHERMRSRPNHTETPGPLTTFCLVNSAVGASTFFSQTVGETFLDKSLSFDRCFIILTFLPLAFFFLQFTLRFTSNRSVLAIERRKVGPALLLLFIGLIILRRMFGTVPFIGVENSWGLHMVPIEVVLTTMVFAPMFEEFFFRFYLWDLLHKNLSRSITTTVLITSVLFLLVHAPIRLGNIEQTLINLSSISLVTVLLAAIRLKTNDYRIAVFLHFFANFVVLCL